MLLVGKSYLWQWLWLDHGFLVQCRNFGQHETDHCRRKACNQICQENDWTLRQQLGTQINLSLYKEILCWKRQRRYHDCTICWSDVEHNPEVECNPACHSWQGRKAQVGHNQSCCKKEKRETSGKSLKMGLFHVNKKLQLLEPCPTKTSSNTAKAFVWIFAITRGSATSPPDL